MTAQNDQPGGPIEPADDDVLESSDDDAADGLEQEDAPRRQFIVRRDKKLRLDVFLQQRLRGVSRSRVQQIIELGGVTVNQKQPKSSTTLHVGDVIDVILPAPAVRSIEPEDIPLDVLFEDEHLIVINKQADLIVHPARGIMRGTLINALAFRFKRQIEQGGGQWAQWKTRGFRGDGPASDEVRSSRPQEGDEPPLDGVVPGLSSVGAVALRPGIVHRLDRHTTGVMVVAKSDFAHWKLARQFEERTTQKAYLAVVHGRVPDDGGVIDQPIGKHPTIREAYAIRHDSTGRASVTIYRVRERYPGYSLVELELKTGRTHQIRVHMSYLGYPLVGDVVYGGEPVGLAELQNPPRAAGGRSHVNFARTREEGEKIVAEALGRPDLLMTHPALHAAYLQFEHPVTRQLVTFTASVHGPMARLVGELRNRQPADTAAPAGQGCFVDLDSALRDAGQV
ncbi:MAG: RluA family pseudouridine synthase [Phycisphaeraceae bacterium]|nr:RluA family pseudouridine synthase [Phycisphaeraceae bacterium]